ncbi:MAG: EFR1 family ferrodoxin [Prevotella sp.]|nr:EFR1 family ferrodoxin [Prevotella sp.]
MKKRIVFYFTATGNSLYIAQTLAGTDGEVLSMPKMLKRKQLDFEADEIGFVFPCLMHLPPNRVREFIATARLKADYFFTVVTYGNDKGSVAEAWDRMSREAGYPMHYIQAIPMVNNWINIVDIEQELQQEKPTQQSLETVEADLAARKHYILPTTDEERQRHQELMATVGLNDDDGVIQKSEQRYASNDDCILCGICTMVCPRGCWHLGGPTSVNFGQCDYCMACIHNCPRKAIQLLPSAHPVFSHEVNPERHYRHPKVTVVDIEMANSQNK